MGKKNCWEVKNCGRQAGGIKAADFGVCPANTERRVDGVNGGTAGGRACWAVTGTLCGGQVQGTFATKLGNCMACEFYKMVQTEEGTAMVTSKVILEKLK